MPELFDVTVSALHAGAEDLRQDAADLDGAFRPAARSAVDDFAGFGPGSFAAVFAAYAAQADTTEKSLEQRLTTDGDTLDGNGGTYLDTDSRSAADLNALDFG